MNYTRISAIKDRINPIIQNIQNEKDKRDAYSHLSGVGLMAAAFALKRGYSVEIAELAEIAGLMHDLLTYVDTKEDTDDHAHKCANYAKKEILDKMDIFTEEEKTMIYNGIYNHSDKHEKGFYFDELIKDADAAEHYLRNPLKDDFKFNPRYVQAANDLVK